MKHGLNLGLWVGAGGLIAVACGGTTFGDVGDIPVTGGAGAGNVAQSAGGEGGTTLGSSGAGARPGGSSGAGARGGAGGSSNGTPIGEGGGPAIETVQCSACEQIADGNSPIAAVATTDERVYWLERGSFDSLENPEGNGRLVYRPLAGGSPVAIHSELAAGIGLAIGSAYAYVLVEHSLPSTGEADLLRVDLASGNAETIEQVNLYVMSEYDWAHDWFQRFFTIKDDVAYWAKGDEIFALPENGAGPGAAVYQHDDAILAMAGDTSRLFFMDAEGLKSVPHAGGVPEVVDEFTQPVNYPAYEQLSIDGESIFALDVVHGFVVSRPKEGGSWKNLRRNHKAAKLLRTDGDAYFVNPAIISFQRGCQLLQASAAELEAEQTLVQGPCPMSSWAISSTSVYFAVGSELYGMPRAD